MTKALHHKSLPSLVLLCVALLWGGGQVYGAIDTPLTVYSANPRYLASDGKPVLFVGNGGPIPSLKNHDYRAEVDMMNSHSVNYGRIWHVLPWASREAYFPWARSGSGTANDGLAKFDLTEWDSNYWSRLKDACAYAQSKDIYLSILLFDECGIEAPTSSSDHRWDWHPFNPSNNVNGLSLPTSGGGVPEFYSLSNSKLKSLQEAYVSKMISETSGYPNVMYEICNEYTGPWDWEEHWIDYVSARCSNIISVNRLGSVPSDYWTNSKIDMVNFHWGTMDAKTTNQKMISYTTNPNTPKAINYDEPPENSSYDTNDYRRVTWASIVGGGHIHLEAYSTDPDPSAAVANIAGFLKENNIPFWEMVPNNARVIESPGGTAHTWEKPGSVYVIQVVGSGGGSMTVDLPSEKTFEAKVYRSDDTYVDLQVSGDTISGIPSYSYDTLVYIREVAPVSTTPDISLALSVDKTQAVPGETLTYTLTYRNDGDGDAKSVAVTSPVPTNTTYVSGSATSGGAYDSTARMVAWTISSIAPGASGTVTYKVTVN